MLTLLVITGVPVTASYRWCQYHRLTRIWLVLSHGLPSPDSLMAGGRVLDFIKSSFRRKSLSSLISLQPLSPLPVTWLTAWNYVQPQVQHDARGRSPTRGLRLIVGEELCPYLSCHPLWFSHPWKFGLDRSLSCSPWSSTCPLPCPNGCVYLLSRRDWSLVCKGRLVT